MGMSALVRPLARRALITGALVVAFAVGTGWLAKVVPTGFLPEEDQGAFFAEVQLAGCGVAEPHDCDRRPRSRK